MQTLAPGTPTPVPTPTSDVPMLAPNAAPQIIAVSMNRSVASAGQILRGAVTTSSNVASVEMRVVTYSVPMTKTAVGHFIVAYAVPKLPFFLRKTYTLQIIARNTAGLETSRDVPLTIR